MNCKTVSIIALSALLFFACAPNPAGEFRSLIEQQPKVLEAEPAANTPLTNPAHFVLHFSQRVDIKSISPVSVTLIRNGWREDFNEDGEKLVDSLKAQELETIPLNYELGGEEETLEITPQISLEAGRYHLVVTPQLTSITGVPFNQSPGSSPQAFYAFYTLGIPEGIGSDTEGTDPRINFGPPPQLLLINEILYDGKFSETDGEAFIELYGTPGSDISGYEIDLVNGTDGETTERILLPMGSLLSDQGLFVIADLRTNSTDATFVSSYDFLDQFDPQNGPDAVQLLDRHGVLWDTLCYGEGVVAATPEGLPLCEGDPAPDVAPGHSLSRLNGVDSQVNHLDFFEKANPSPGQL
jgi:hypothetical protein